MSDTLANFISRIRVSIDERTAQYYLDTDLTNWINEGARELARRAEVGQAKSTSIAVVSGTATYTMPTDVIQIHRMEFVPTGASQIYPIEMSTYEQMDRIWGWQQNIQSSYPSWVVFWGEPPSLTAQLFPVPSQAGILNVYYYQVPTAVTTSTQTVTCPAGWEDVIELYTEYRALRRAKDPEWQGAKTIYEEKLQSLIDKTVQWHDQANSMVVGQNSIPSWLYGPGDF